MTWQVTHDAVQHRFGALVEGQHCTLDYELDGSTIIITHVKVPDPVAGRGIAAALTEAALTHARSVGWRVVPQCPYAVDYVHKHAGWSDVLARP